MEALARRSCAEHPDRHSHAVCIQCGKQLCQECTTQWEGINYCRACLATVAAAPARKTRSMSLIIMIVFSVIVALALVRVAVGVGVYLARML